MIKVISIIITLVFTSFYFFPIEFKFLPGANTKMVMAGCGLLLLGIKLAKQRLPEVKKDVFILSMIAALVSLCGIFSAFYNNTPDFTYATYIVSMWVWMAGAYLLLELIKAVHNGFVSLFLLGNYLIAVCVMQCLLALVIDYSVSFEYAVNRVVMGLDFVNNDVLSETGRLYGIGASLDVAGIRFSAILIMITYLCVIMSHRLKSWHYVLYIAAFVIIGVVGNIMSRTTTVGVILALVYLIYSMFNTKTHDGGSRFTKWLISMLLVFIPVVVLLYYVDPQMRENLRFGFEGFFSLAESGTWTVHSNEILKNMIVWPDNLKTWLIGDGYIVNPNVTDPYYIGPIWHGYYQQTDIGYLRFIFYFGLIGLFCFCSYFVYVTKCCINRFPHYKMLFFMLLLLNFIVWLKVSTDLFCLFAIFLVFEEKDEVILGDKSLDRQVAL